MTENNTKERVVSREVAQHVLWHFGDRNWGQQGGKFTERLLMLIQSADRTNLEKLRQVYPEHVEAVMNVATKAWGLDWLQKIVRELAAPAEEQSAEVAS